MRTSNIPVTHRQGSNDGLFRFKSTLTNLLIAACALLPTCKTSVGQEVEFSTKDAETAKMVVQLIQARHLENQPLNDDLSSNAFDAFIEAWDPNRIYFLATDIAQFEANRKLLDDQLRSGQLQFASTVFSRFIERNDALQSKIQSAIDADHDFELEESIVKDASTIPWATSFSEISERWRKRIKFQMLNEILDGETQDTARKKLKRRYESNFNLLKQTEEDEVLELFLTSFMRGLDPHSRYFSPTSEEEFTMAMSLKLTGIGARLRHDLGSTVVEEVITGGAASADGRLESGDVIVGVGQGADGDIQDIVGLKLQNVVDQIRGTEGAVVRLKVQKAAGGDAVEYALTRKKIVLEDQRVSGVVVDAGLVQKGSTQRIGVLTIPSFYRDFRQAAAGKTFRSTAQDVKAVLKDFKRQDVSAIIVDMRDNTGGALAEAVEVTGLFLPTGPVVQMQARGAKPEVLSDEDKDWAWRGPMVVLCDRMTASASEIVASAIRDYRRGLIVGDTATHGKGSVQNILNLQTQRFATEDRGAIKLTIGTWHGVSGNSSQQTGVPSDIVLPSVADTDAMGEASLEHALPNQKTQRLNYLPFQHFLNEEVVSVLRDQSATRVAGNDGFSKTQERIKFIKQREARTDVSLNLTVQRQQRDAARALLTVEDPVPTTDVAEDQEFASDYYNREVLQITLDYLRLLQKSA